MAQLVERRVRNAKVRGSNPLISTTKYRTFVRYFFMWDRGFPRFHRGVALQHEPLRANASKREQVHFLRYYGSVQVASYESPYLHHKISYICMIFFYVGIGDSHDFIVVLLCNMNPCGLTLRNVNKFTFFAITEASRSLPTNPPYLHNKSRACTALYKRGYIDKCIKYTV